jgi:hypothetical protein
VERLSRRRRRHGGQGRPRKQRRDSWSHRRREADRRRRNRAGAGGSRARLGASTIDANHDGIVVADESVLDRLVPYSPRVTGNAAAGRALCAGGSQVEALGPNEMSGNEHDFEDRISTGWFREIPWGFIARRAGRWQGPPSSRDGPAPGRPARRPGQERAGRPRTSSRRTALRQTAWPAWSA